MNDAPIVVNSCCYTNSADVPMECCWIPPEEGCSFIHNCEHTCKDPVRYQLTIINTQYNIEGATNLCARHTALMRAFTPAPFTILNVTNLVGAP